MSFYRPFGYAQKFVPSETTTDDDEAPVGPKGEVGDDGYFLANHTTLTSGQTLTPAQISPFSVIKTNVAKYGFPTSGSNAIVATDFTMPSVASVISAYPNLVVGDTWEFTILNINTSIEIDFDAEEGTTCTSGKIQLLTGASWSTYEADIYMAPKTSTVFKCVITSATEGRLYRLTPTTAEGQVAWFGGSIVCNANDATATLGTTVTCYDWDTQEKVGETVLTGLDYTFSGTTQTKSYYLMFESFGKTPSFRLMGSI